MVGPTALDFSLMFLQTLNHLIIRIRVFHASTIGLLQGVELLYQG